MDDRMVAYWVAWMAVRLVVVKESLWVEMSVDE